MQTNCKGCGKSVDSRSLITLKTGEGKSVDVGACCAVPALHITIPVDAMEQSAIKYGQVAYILAAPNNC
jgi:hypothetical protein